MFEKLEAVEKRYEELTKMISDPEVISNQSEWQKLMKEHASIEDIVLKFREYKKAKEAMEEAKEMMEDKELKELAEAEYYDNKDFNSDDVYDISRSTDKEDELFDYANIPSYMKSNKNTYNEKDKDDFELEK